ncbi:DUF2252 domain-containing protein [Gloeothece verrucosa]|uniref:DUF2252 domain-containing protein n=1 Tax=Gloeothece verrucosa (strain PCC 7822) TaxID=497965 RepID=E0UI27_GLOV7|nr:DUF2252 domain-containing protein [Gloeothece verrucosa]ADN15679.1 Protein of unknown function DUF2252 [Gloeothece verrucosa PCC 7822]
MKIRHFILSAFHLSLHFPFATANYPLSKGEKFKLGLIYIVLILSLTCIAFPCLAGTNRSEKIINEITTKNQFLLKNNPDLLTYKYCKMSESNSPFPFYRATNYLFWEDLANDSRLKNFGNSKTQIWLSGDLHLENLGTFNNNLEEIVFDINDFDESLIADYQLDLWRMATSIILVARDNNLSKEEAASVVDAFTETYLNTLAAYRGNDDELKTYFTEDNTEGMIKKLLNKAQKQTRQQMLDKWVENTEGKAQFKAIDQKLEKLTVKEDVIQKAMAAYGKTLVGKLSDNPSYFKVKSVAKRLNAGLGSLGVPRYYVLIEGETKALNDDRILDVKYQSRPTAYEYLRLKDQEKYDAAFKNDAERHAIAYRALVKHTDDYLGWLKLSDGYYSVRELSPYKKALDTEKLNEGSSFEEVAKQWGKILATDHASADKDFDAGIIPYSFDKQVDEQTKDHHQEFRELVKKVAFDYADQVKADYDVFVKALKPKNCPEN